MKAPTGGAALVSRRLSWTGETLDSISDSVTPANSETFTYTQSHRLASASGAYGSLSWTYDSDGNRASQTIGGAVQAYAYPSNSNMLASITQSGAATRSFTYDAAGNRASDATGLTTDNEGYDGGDRLRGVSQRRRLRQGVAPSQGARSPHFDGFWASGRETCGHGGQGGCVARLPAAQTTDTTGSCMLSGAIVLARMRERPSRFTAWLKLQRLGG